jgi:hypothetical protein
LVLVVLIVAVVTASIGCAIMALYAAIALLVRNADAFWADPRAGQIVISMMLFRCRGIGRGICESQRLAISQVANMFDA